MQDFVHKWKAASAQLFGAMLLVLPMAASAQLPTAPSVPLSSLQGSVTSGPPTETAIPLSLDDAVKRGLQHNLAIVLTAQNQRAAAGERLVAINYLMPVITGDAQRSRNQINLAAMGFRPGTFKKFPAGLIPPGTVIPAVVTVNVVEAQATLDQPLFNLQSWELYRAAKQEIRAVDYSFQSARGAVIQDVAGSYLSVLAAEANVRNANSLLTTNAEILRQANLEHQAGTVAGLDVLRAKVQYRQQEQVVIASQNALEKAKVALNRQIGLPADQPIDLTDRAPYGNLSMMPLDRALGLAYRNRQEYLRLQAELRSAELQSRAARYERMPTLDFNGNYGVTGTVGGVYHGTFLAQGTLTIPLFREAKLRGDRDVSLVRQREATARLANFRGQIQAEVRDSMLDVSTTRQLVNVARSNVDLSLAALNDTQDRFRNGVADDLPVVEAQSTLAGAQAQLVSSLYRYNVAKLALARSIGVIDREFHNYLGTQPAAAQNRPLHGVNSTTPVPSE